MSQPLTKLTSNLWVHQSELYFTNSGVFLDDGQACLIDPGVFPHEIQRIAAFVKEQDAEPQGLVLTHSHWDHILGPAFFPGVKIIAQNNYVNEVSGENEAPIQRQIKKWETEYVVKRTQTFMIPLPDQTFDKKMSLTVGSLSFELIHAPGHAADQLIIYQPDQKILWAADMLSDLEIPFVSDNLAAYQATLKMLSGFEIEVLIPGHGFVTKEKAEIRTRINEDIDYLAELHDKVEQAVRAGETLHETIKHCSSMHYRRPEDNVGPHRLNVESVYLELGGPADSTKVGWNKLDLES